MSRFKKIKGLSIYDDDDLRGLEETSVVFNKEGWYFDRLTQESWYEIETSTGIRAFKSDKPYFEYCLKIANHIPLSDREVRAIKILLLYNRKVKGLWELYDTDRQWKELRETYRGSRKYTLRALKDIL